MEEIKNYGVNDLSTNYMEISLKTRELEEKTAFYRLLESQLEEDSPVTNELVDRLRISMKEAEARSISRSCFSHLEEQWKGLFPDPEERDWHPLNLELSIHPIQYFIERIWERGYPPPEYLFAIVVGFQRYLKGEGEISLDEAFFNQKHLKRSSFAFKNRINVYEQFADELRIQYFNPKSSLTQEKRRKYEGLSRLEIAEIFISEYPRLNRSNIDPESFLRGFDRWVKSIEESKDSTGLLDTGNDDQ